MCIVAISGVELRTENYAELGLHIPTKSPNSQYDVALARKERVRRKTSLIAT